MTVSQVLAAGLVVLGTAVAPALAKDARCYTTDDGYFDCNFKPLGEGSFEISAEGYPTFQVMMDSPGIAFASGQYEPGGRFIGLPGTFTRNEDDGACWDNEETEVQICAW